MADAITTKNITSVDEVQSVDNTDKVFVNDNGSFKQISVSNLMKQATTGITEETDPTVPTWAKELTKPTYTADEVGALPVGTKIPAKTSDLTNDSGYLTQIPEEYVTETELGQKGYITEDDIPDKLPSPGTLTFIGAVNDTYDGSTDKTINIPTGGGGGSGTGTGIKGLADLCLALKGTKYETLEASQAAQRFVEANEGGGSGEPITPTLTSITVTWSADSADVGTDPKTLISYVKANYSDGTSQTVIEYTVTPKSLVEGNNTVIVTYNGKSTTKNITGVAEQVGGAEVVMLAPVQKSGVTVTDYSDGGYTAFVGSTTNNNNRWMVRSEKVFDKDTVLRVQMSRDSQTYNAVDLFSCDTEVWDGVSAVTEKNGHGFYGVKTVDSATWVNPFSLDMEYTVKAGYAFMYCTYSAIDANTLNVMITEVA